MNAQQPSASSLAIHRLLRCARPFAATAVATALVVVVSDASALEISPRGRIHLDYAWHDADVASLDDGFRTRRARIGLQGKIDDNWSFTIEYDLAENGTDAKDLVLQYGGWDVGNVKIGHYKVPFSLEELTSSNNITFIERSLPTTTFAQSRRIGAGLSMSGDNYTFNVMGFGQPMGSSVRSTSGSPDSGDEGLGIGGRFTFTPVNSDSMLLHLGVAATTEQPANKATREVRLRTRPESRPTNIRLVDTGTLTEVDRINQLGVEAAWQMGPFSLQGEWMGLEVARRSGFDDVDFTGWYVGGSWVVTGEKRGYRGGVFRGVSPSGPGGAWELVARYSNINLDDDVVFGGEEDNLTLGVNWYVNANIRFMANYIRVESDRQGVADDPNIFLVRAQVSF